MPSYKLIYFNTKGRAEMTRLLFAAAGVNYEDSRVTGEEFQELKSSGKLPFNQLPVLEVDGKFLSQSCTILKYVARETGLAPSDSWEVAKADMINDGIQDMMAKALQFYLEKDEEQKKKLTKEFYENILPKNLTVFEKLLKSSGGKYFAENKLTYADIRFFSSMNLLFQEIKEDIPPVLDNYPALKDLYNTVRSNAGIKEWLSKLPEKK